MKGQKHSISERVKIGRKAHKKLSRRLLTETGAEKIARVNPQPVSSYKKLPDEIF